MRELTIAQSADLGAANARWWRSLQQRAVSCVHRDERQTGPTIQFGKANGAALGFADQLRLITEFAAALRSEAEREPKRSLLEPQGLRKEIWQEYLRQEQSSWNE